MTDQSEQQRAKKVVFDSLGLVDFAIAGWWILFLTCPMGKEVIFGGEIQITEEL